MAVILNRIGNIEFLTAEGISVPHCFTTRLGGVSQGQFSSMNIGILRGITVVCATMITASCVSMCGQVGWVGLLVPHMCRMKFGSNHLALLPASISFGAAFLIIVDTVARSACPQEIPISILTAIIGAPFFIILMRKSGGWSL